MMLIVDEIFISNTDYLSKIFTLCEIDDLWGDVDLVVGTTGLGSEEAKTKEKRIT